jgi:hypothetical protein
MTKLLDRLTGKERLSNDVKKKVEQRIRLFVQEYGMPEFNNAKALLNQPSLCDQDYLSDFFRQPHRVWIEKLGNHETIFAKNRNCWILAARKNRKLGFENSYNENIELWTRFSTKSREYKVHHSNSKSKKKSKFRFNIDEIEQIELQAIHSGVGILSSENELRFYLKFDRAIGDSPTGKPLNYVCVELARENRAKGYRVKFHGYPISGDEIQVRVAGTDFSVGAISTIAY